MQRVRVMLCGLIVPAAMVGWSAGCNQTPPQTPPDTQDPPTSRIALQVVAEGLTSPLAMAVPDDGTQRLFIVDQVGLIRIVNSDGTLQSAPFLDVADRMPPIGIDFGGGFIYDERGLLGLAFHPQYASNGRFYAYYNTPRQPGDPQEADSRVRLSEFRVSAADPNQADPGSERVLFEVVKPQFNHNGGQLAFGPDGFLYVSLGDGGGADDTDFGHNPDIGNGQDLGTLLGKILRIDVDGGLPYAVPPDNPFVNTAGARSEIWALGFRNPWRFSFDPGGARRLFTADAGQELFEEVSIVQRGGNYGWRIREGFHCFDPQNPTAPPGQCPATGRGGEPLVDPIIEYPHAQADGRPVGIAVIGGFVYRGSAISGLAGEYIFGDFSTSFGAADGSIFAAREMPDGTWERRELEVAGRSGGRIERFVLGMGQDEDGEVYVLTTANLAPSGQTGQVYRIVAAP